MKRYGKQILLFLLAVLLLTGWSAVGTEPAAAAFDGQIIILHTNDVRGSVAVTDAAGGARLGIASVSQMKRDLEEMDSFVLLLDAGGFADGTELVRRSGGRSAVEWMTAAGYDAACIGMDELGYGYPQLQTLAAAAGFPLLAANITEADAETACLQTQAVFTAPDGTKIGVFGLVTPEVKTALHPAVTEGLTVSGGDDRIVCAQAQVTQLQEAGCDLIICLGPGSEAEALIEAVEGIDLFLAGTDGEGGIREIGGTLVVSAAENLEEIGMTVWDGTSLESTLYTRQGYDGVDAAVNELVLAEEEALAAWYEAEFAASDAALGIDDTRESSFGDLVCDAMLWQAQQLDPAADAALIESGSLLSALPAGTLTRAAVRDALAETTLHLLDVTGAQLLAALEAAAQYAPEASPDFLQVRGIQYLVDTNVAYDPAKPGSRVEILSVNGADFDPAAVYTLAISGTLAEAVFADAAVCYDLRSPLTDAVVGYMADALGGALGDSYAEPKKRITLILIPFADVEPEDWYFDAVQYVYEHGLMNGVDETHFNPTGTMTRSMMVTMLHRLSGSPAPEGSAAEIFADVPADAWYAEAVAWAVETGITQGMGDGRFQPDGILSRQQMATFFYRHAQVYGDVSAADGYELTYYDTAEIADWARDAVAYCTAVGLMQGVENNRFAPDADANRAMGATILMRFAKMAAV